MQKIGPETFSGPAERWEKPAGWEQAAIYISMAFSASTHILTGKFPEMKMVNIFVYVFHQMCTKIVSAGLGKYWYSLLWRTSSGIDNLHNNHFFTSAYNVDVS